MTRCPDRTACLRAIRGGARRHPRLAAGAGGAEQLDARRDRPDSRNVHMIVLLREFLSGFTRARRHRHRCSAKKRRVASGFSASFRATPGRPLRRRLTAGGARRSPSDRAKAAARKCPASSAVRRAWLQPRRCGRSTPSPAPQFVDAVVPGGDLHHQPVDPRQQRRHQLGATTARRINLSLRHGERESARRTRPNLLRPGSQRRRGVSNYNLVDGEVASCRNSCVRTNELRPLNDLILSLVQYRPWLLEFIGGTSAFHKEYQISCWCVTAICERKNEINRRWVDGAWRQVYLTQGRYR